MSQQRKKPRAVEEFKPRGTVLILVLFAVTLVVLWGTVYLTMVNQGATTP